MTQTRSSSMVAPMIDLAGLSCLTANLMCD
jgi:hypothetical protein